LRWWRKLLSNMWAGIEAYPTTPLIHESDYSDSYDREHTPEAIKQLGEVFTPTPLVNKMLNKLPPELFTDKTKTFLDNSCGNGQFLAAVLERKMANGITHKEALQTLYGVELDPQNAEECRQRLFRGKKSKELRAIVDHNIITADALDPNHRGWRPVGFYWEQPKERNFFEW